MRAKYSRCLLGPRIAAVDDDMPGGKVLVQRDNHGDGHVYREEERAYAEDEAQASDAVFHHLHSIPLSWVPSKKERGDITYNIVFFQGVPVTGPLEVHVLLSILWGETR